MVIFNENFTMKLYLVQYSPTWEDKEANKTKITELLLNKVEKNDISRLIVLPELTLTGFTMKSSQFAEDLKGDSFSFYKESAKRFSSFIAAGLIEKSGEKYYNTLLILNPSGELIGTYRKIHPFSYSTEDKYYSKGTDSVIVEIGEWKVGLTICYDLRFPELYRLYGKQGADLILNIANWPVTRIEHWRTLLKARAIENQCFMAGVNRCGNDPKLLYNGQSAVFDPMGNIISDLSESEIIIITELNKNLVAETRTKFPFLQDITLI